MSRKLKKINCRACQGKASQRGYFYRCRKKICGAVFWHRKVLFEDLENDIVFKEQLSLAEIPHTIEKDYHVYVIQLSRKKNEIKDSVYVGMTWRHPYERYLWHLCNKIQQGSSHVIKRGKVMIDFEGPMSKKKAEKREAELAKELKERFIVYGGH